MSEALIVFVTCEGRKQAEQLATNLIERRFAACVNVVPGVRSCYAWEGKLQWSEEVLLLVKTTRERYDRLQAVIRELHSNEVPEIVAVPIEEGLPDYLQWVRDAVS